MPGIQLFKRTWLIASDDLVIPFGISLILRTVWVITVAVIFVLHLHFGTHKSVDHSGNDCQRIHIYFIGYIVLLISGSFVEVVITIVSSRGTIFDTEVRKNIPSYLYVRGFIFFIEIIWCGIGLYYIFGAEKACGNYYDRLTAKLTVSFHLVWIISSFVVIYLCFDYAGDLWYILKNKDKHKSKYGSIDTLEFKKRILKKEEKSWSSNFKLLFCCTKRQHDRDNVLLLASKIFAKYFSDYTNLVPSDILAGLILLRQKQKYEESQRVKEELKNTNASYQQVTKHKSHTSVRRHQKTINSSPFNMEDETEMAVLDTITHFAKFALAAYGWPFYCFLNKFPICHPKGCKLMSRTRCCACCRKVPSHYPEIKDDNCCFCNFAAQKATLDNIDENFIYVSYSDEVFYTPFCVLLDHVKEAVIISCRGTLSLKDVLTDMSIEEECIPGYNSEWTAHSGFLRAAMAIKEKLEEKQLIQEALSFDHSKGTENYQIIIVGHSLGAGTATLLAYLLRPDYPNLKCYAYGPSGSAVCYDASVYAKDFIYSVVLGKDLVARLNMNTLNELQHNIMQLLEKTKLPKWRILHGCICNCLLCCTRSSTHSFDEYFESEEEIMNFEPYDSTLQSKLYMAGKVVHICKTKSIYPRFGSKKATYQVFWSTPTDFQNILISNLMLKDHFPDTLIMALTKILPSDIEEIILDDQRSCGSASIEDLNDFANTNAEGNKDENSENVENVDVLLNGAHPNPNEGTGLLSPVDNIA